MKIKNIIQPMVLFTIAIVFILASCASSGSSNSGRQTKTPTFIKPDTKVSNGDTEF